MSRVSRDPTDDFVAGPRIADLDYVGLLSLVREENRCPGGLDTLRRVVVNTMMGQSSNVLEVGSNTGYTSLELARLTRGRFTGVDTSADAVRAARFRLAQDVPWVQDRVSFSVASAYELPFPAETFSHVVVGGATTFMAHRDRAISEYVRVMETWGFLSATHLFYRETPPPKVVSDISDVLGVEVPPWSDRDWEDLFTRPELEMYYTFRGALHVPDDDEVAAHVEMYRDRPGILSLPKSEQDLALRRWSHVLRIFAENHRYLGYVTMLFRKRGEPHEPELFRRLEHDCRQWPGPVSHFPATEDHEVHRVDGR